MSEFEWQMLGLLFVAIGLIVWIAFVAIEAFFKIDDYGKERKTETEQEAKGSETEATKKTGYFHRR